MTAPGTTVRTIEHQGHVHAVAFSPDGASVATGDDTGVVRMSPVAGTGGRVVVTAGDFVPGVAFSPDGALVAAVSRGTVAVRDAVSGAGGWDLAAGADHQFFHVAGFSPDGSRFAVGTDRTVVVADAGSGAVQRTITVDGGIGRIAWGDLGPASDGRAVRHLAVGTFDATALVFDVTDGSEVARLPHGAEVTELAWHPVRPALLTGGGDGTVRLHHLPSGRVVWSTQLRAPRVGGLAFDPGGRWVVCGDPEVGSTRILHASVGVERLRSTNEDFLVAVAVGGTSFVRAFSEGVEVVDLPGGTVRYSFSAHGVNAVVFSPGAEHLAVASEQTVHVLRNA